MAGSPNIVVVGSLNMDLVMRAPRLPNPGETVLGGSFDRFPGGKGANQAVAAARLGATVAMVGRVGDDPFGEALRDSLEENRVDHRAVLTDPKYDTGVGMVLVDYAGSNSILVASGANMALTPADVESAEWLIAGADVVVLQLEVPMETVERAADLARGHGALVVLNPAPAQPLSPELLNAVDLLIPNEDEATALTGKSVNSKEEARAAARALRDSGADTVILTMGGRGALLSDVTGTDLLPALNEVEPVDTTAAGDAFVGGMAVALGEGMSLMDAVGWANIVGGLATLKPGAQPSLPTRDEVEAKTAEKT